MILKYDDFVHAVLAYTQQVYTGPDHPCLPVTLHLAAREAELGPSFTCRVRRYMEARRLSPPDVYNTVDMDRRLFSKIMHDEHYQPTKVTALKMALGLRLNLEDTLILLNSAGYTLSHSILFDVIMEYCILHQQYDVYNIGALLHDFKVNDLCWT